MARTHAFDRRLYRGNRPNRLARMINSAPGAEVFPATAATATANA